MSKRSRAMTDTTITVRVSTELRNRLEAIAKETRRSKSFLSNEAIEEFVAAEEQELAAIREGLEDMREGRTISHEEALRRLDAAIAQAARKSA
jgi:predicted transcriptional regulator